nr:SpoIIE family protein phosphatase [Pseudonocardiales bacterium]
DMATGETRWDERLEALFGLPPGGFDGSFDSYVAQLHPADRDWVLATVQDAVATRSSYRVEHRVLWPNGTDRWIAAAGGVTVDEHDVVTGTIGCAMDITERAQQDEERARLTAIAVDAAASERVQRERLEFLAVVNEALNQSHSVAEIMDHVTAAAVPRLGDWCSIYVLSRDHPTPDIAIAHIDPEMVAYARQLQERFPYDADAETGIPQVIRTGEPVFFPEITEDLITELDATDEERAVINQLALRSAIAVPLIKHGRILGAIQFVMSSSSRRYTDDDIALAQTVAGRIASSVENVRLNEQQRTIAQTLQRSLLPAQLPDVPGADIAVRYWASGEGTEVGGDFYDVFALDHPDQWAIVIGDVCGTGPEAAALTALARHSIRDSAWHGDDPTQVLGALARAVTRSAPQSFCTAIYAQYDRAARPARLTIACGGHPLPVHVTAHGATPVGAPGTLLGMVPNPVFHPRTITVTADDVIVFYTDGATDQPPPHDLDEATFTALIERCVTADATAAAIADRIHRQLEAVQPFDQRDDDIAILVVRFTD